ncbi:MAG: cyanophycin synthetase [Firmicutes bacterium]|jgi:cyanophycin synthetase|uniref:Cyanophycin synthetase n=1 Tax=Sulfobacillus benefaciens TaxID=453960 RepID=A0A2T2X8Q3_9FIRM|nr:cyanophycin synthetase [Bacillota bacterium]MCL5014265.1 cyanophycin synthetase [Bacillota bacterium]PSR30865.1 MAG: cyanophycin synthetase [Sulfobacillus benefaciens]
MIEIRSSRFYPGPNRYTLHSAFEAIVRLGSYRLIHTGQRPDVVNRLLDDFPGLKKHVCSLGHAGGFVERLREGTYMGHVIEHVALELLYLSGEDGHYGRTREISGTEDLLIVFESETDTGGETAFRVACQRVEQLWNNQPGKKWSECCQDVLNIIREKHLGPSTQAIVQAARARGIPVWRINDGSLVRLGQGIHQKRIAAATSDETSVIAVDICQDKVFTKNYLARNGIRVPESRTVESRQEALRAARELEFPVVIKPQRGHQGQGVSVNVDTPEKLFRAFDWAWENRGDGTVMVEEQIRGKPYRILVVGDQIAAASLRMPPFVSGDGIHTINQLIDEENRNPVRGPRHSLPLSPIERGPALMMALERQNRTLETVPARGEIVFLRDTANLSCGGEAMDVSNELSPDLALDMVRAAKLVGLDIAGIDIVVPSLSSSLREGGGAVIEINASPGLRMHLFPSKGQPRPVGEIIVQRLFPRHDGRIPVSGITGTNGKTTVTRMLAHIWQETGRCVGMTSTDGITIGGRVVEEGDLTGPWAAQVVLGDPSVEVAVLETARGGMARHGLGFSDLDVAVVTNIGADHLGQDGVDTLDDLTRLKALLVDVVRPEGVAVLNADDPYVVPMAKRTNSRIIWFSAQKDSQFLQEELSKGQGAVVLRHGYLTYQDKRGSRRIIGARALPVSWRGRADINIKNAMAAAGAAIAMGLDPAFVGKSLGHFALDSVANPGRLEMIRGRRVDVMLDYAHNAPALEALGKIVSRLGYRHIRTVLGLPGDRRTQDLACSVKQAVLFSDDFVVREDADPRGRKPGEVAELIVHSLSHSGVKADQIQVIHQEAEAVAHAVATSPDSSLVVVLFESYQTVKNTVEEVLSSRNNDMEVS